MTRPITGLDLRKAFRKARKAEEEYSMTALAYYPHVAQTLREVENLDVRHLDRLAAILNEERAEDAPQS